MQGSVAFLKRPERKLQFLGAVRPSVSAAAVDRTYVGKCGCVPAKLHFQEQKMGWVCPRALVSAAFPVVQWKEQSFGSS